MPLMTLSDLKAQRGILTRDISNYVKRLDEMVANKLYLSQELRGLERRIGTLVSAKICRLSEYVQALKYVEHYDSEILQLSKNIVSCEFLIKKTQRDLADLDSVISEREKEDAAMGRLCRFPTK